MLRYLLTLGAGLLVSIGLLSPHMNNREESIKTSKCLRCSEGVGELQQRHKGKVSYTCNNCGSTWVERI